MSLDKNSDAYRKGLFGEYIAKHFFEAQKFYVCRPGGVSDDVATHFDWECWRNGVLKFFIEVKTGYRITHSFDNLPVQRLSLIKYNGYKAEAAKFGVPFYLVYVVEDDGKIYYRNAANLDRPFQRAEIKFPVYKQWTDGDPNICFHVDQFHKANIPAAELADLRAGRWDIKDTKDISEKLDDYLNRIGCPPYYFREELTNLEHEFGTQQLINAIQKYVGNYHSREDNFNWLELFTAVYLGDDDGGDFGIVEAKLRAVFQDGNYSFDKINAAQQLAAKHLGVKQLYYFPDKEKEIVVLAKNARKKLESLPYFLCAKLVYDTMYHLRNFFWSRNFALFVHHLADQFHNMREKRQKNFQPLADLKIVNAAKVTTLTSPTNASLKILRDRNNPETFYLQVSQLGNTVGYRLGSAATDGSNFLRAVMSVATVFKSKDGKRIIRSTDVKRAFEEFAFNYAHNQERYDKAIVFLNWWKDAGEPFIRGGAS